MIRTILYLAAGALFCVQLQAAQARPNNDKNEKNGAFSDLIDQLLTGKPLERVEAQYRLSEESASVASRLMTKLTAKRPVMARSFAMKLRLYLTGEGRAMEFLDNQSGNAREAMRLQNGNAPADPKGFPAYAKRTTDDNELYYKLLTYSFVAGASRENSDATVALLERKNEQLRRCALAALERYSAFPIPAEKIAPFLNPNILQEFLPAARILARQNEEGIVDSLFSRVRSEPFLWGGILAPAFADCPVETLAPRLKELLSDPEPRMQVFAAGYLLALNESKDEAEAKLKALLDAPIPEVKITAAWVLYEFSSDAVKEVVRAKITLARSDLNQVYLGATPCLAEIPDGKKHAQDLARRAPVMASRGTGTWMIDLRDQLRLGLDKEVRGEIDGAARAVAQELDMAAPAPVAKTLPMRSQFKLGDRYIYSIMATVLSELDPETYQKSIKACVAAITSRQLGCGLWSYRDPTQKERDDFGDGYAAASATDYEFPQGFYALSGLDSAINFGGAKVEGVVFLRAMRGLLYSQYVDGSFTNYPQASPYPMAPLKMMSAEHTAWGLGMLAICLRQGKEDLGNEPDVLVRGYIARQAAYTNLRERVLNNDANVGGNMFPLRELAYTFGNKGLLSPHEIEALEQALKFSNAGNGLYSLGFPEPADVTARPWVEVLEIGRREKSATQR